MMASSCPSNLWNEIKICVEQKSTISFLNSVHFFYQHLLSPSLYLMKLGRENPSVNLCCIEFKIKFSTFVETDENGAIIALGDEWTSRAHLSISLR